MLGIKKGLAVKGTKIDREPITVEGEIISILENTVVVSTIDHGNVIIKKCDITPLKPAVHNNQEELLINDL